MSMSESGESMALRRVLGAQPRGNGGARRHDGVALASPTNGRAPVEVAGVVHTVSTTSTPAVAAGQVVEVEFGAAIPRVVDIKAGAGGGGGVNWGTVEVEVLGTSGEFSFPHGLGAAPSTVLVTQHRVEGDNTDYRNAHIAVYSIDASTITCRASDQSGTSSPSGFIGNNTTLRLSWWAAV